MAKFEAPVALFDLCGLVHIGNYLVVFPFDGDSPTYSLERSLILTGELDVMELASLDQYQNIYLGANHLIPGGGGGVWFFFSIKLFFSFQQKNALISKLITRYYSNETFPQCYFNVRPTSATLAQH